VLKFSGGICTHNPEKEKPMNWQMLTAIGQFATVLAGIPSVIYLAIQIRSQTKERRVSAVNALTVQWGEMTNALHDSAELSEVYLRGAQSFVDLDPVSKLRFSAFFNRFVNHFEAMYFARRAGILTESAWGKVERTMSDLVACPGVQQWWKVRKHWHTPEFGQMIDAILASRAEPKGLSIYGIRREDPWIGDAVASESG
jgi:hypothetical protein